MEEHGTKIEVRSYRVMVVNILLMMGFAILMEYRSGAFSHEFIGDDTSHYITGLLIRNYLASGTFSSPLAFSMDYFSHYQFVGFGLWPPAYHLLEGAWMLVFSDSRASVMLLQATLAAFLGWLITFHLAPRYGDTAALLGGLGVIAMPFLQDALANLQIDLLVAVLTLLSGLAYARYLETGLARYSMLFGIVATGVVMTKGNGGMLALTPGLVVVLSGRWRLLAKPSFWLPVPLVLAVAVPWYLLTYSWASAGFRFRWGWSYFATSATWNAAEIASAVGPAVVVLAAIGLVARVKAERKSSERGAFWTVLAAILLSCLLFQSIVPAALQTRYLLPVVGPLAAFAVAGVADSSGYLARYVSKITHRGFSTALSALALALYLPGPLAVVRSPDLGMSVVADVVLPRLPSGNPVVLIGSDADGEGAFSSEMAMRDNNEPRIFVIRGSRLLGGGGYNNFEYKPRFKSAEEVMAELDALSVPLVVLDTSEASYGWEHNRQISEAIKLYPERWQQLQDFRLANREAHLYLVRGNETKPADSKVLSSALRPRKKIPGVD